MSDRYYALTVILEEPIKDEDAEELIAAIRMLRHVADVQPLIADAGLYFAQETARMELVKMLWDALRKP